jgi:histone H3/H4
LYYISLLALLKKDVALKEIEYYQRKTGLLIPRTAFARLCVELLSYYGVGSRFKMTASAFAAVQQLSEEVLVLFFELCNKAAIHAKRVTVMPRDAQFVKDFIKTVDPTNPIGDAQPVKPRPASINSEDPVLSGTISQKKARTAYRTLGNNKSQINRVKGKAVIKKNSNTMRRR